MVRSLKYSLLSHFMGIYGGVQGFQDPHFAGKLLVRVYNGDLTPLFESEAPFLGCPGAGTPPLCKLLYAPALYI